MNTVTDGGKKREHIPNIRKSHIDRQITLLVCTILYFIQTEDLFIPYMTQILLFSGSISYIPISARLYAKSRNSFKLAKVYSILG